MRVSVCGKHSVWMYQQVVKVRLPLNTPWRHMGHGGKIHLFLTSGTSCRWVAYFAPHPIFSRDPVTTWFVGPHSRSWRFVATWIHLSLPWIEPRSVRCQTVGESLWRIRYFGPR